MFRFWGLMNLVWLGFSFCYSQKIGETDTFLINKCLSEASYFLDRYPDSTFYFADKALKLSIKLLSPKHISKAKQCLGRYYINKEYFGKATSYFLEALKIEEKRKDEKRIADLNDDLGCRYLKI